MVYRTVPFSITLNDPNTNLKITPLFSAEYLRNGVRYIVTMNYHALLKISRVSFLMTYLSDLK